MLKYFLRRLLAMIPKLIIISLVVFFALQLLPGDAVTRSVSPDVYRNMTPEQLEAAKHPDELPRSRFTIVRCSLVQQGVAGDDSWGAPVLPPFLIPGAKRICFEMKMRGI